MGQTMFVHAPGENTLVSSNCRGGRLVLAVSFSVPTDVHMITLCLQSLTRTVIPYLPLSLPQSGKMHTGRCSFTDSSSK